MANHLWRKEPTSDIFVDLLDSSLPYEYEYNTKIQNAKHRFHDKQYEPVKSDSVSTEFRVAGNDKFKQRKWRQAMEYYNQSLRFAEENSENMSLAYQNRSTCFFNMQKYNRCLKDIELAREHNHLKRLMQKLDEREAECVQHMNEENDSQEEEIEPKLSFDGDEQFPCMANVLEIKTNDKLGRQIVAKCDIDVGQTVIVEKGFVTVFNARDRTLCRTCMKQVQNFIPCSGCTDVMFCDKTCVQSNDTHQIACGAPFNRIPGSIQNCAESILIAIKLFRTVEDLMEFVENQLTSPQTEMPRNCSDAQLQYGLFLKLDKMRHDEDPYQNILKYITYKLLMAIPSINEKFNTKKKKRFLMHLIWQHANIEERNVFFQTFDDKDNKGEGERELLSTGNMYGLLEHSCIPNLHTEFFENKLVLITLRPVKQGEQLFVCYAHHLWWEPPAKRQQHLKSIYDFNCECARCKLQTDSECSIISQDPLYRSIMRLSEKTIITKDERKIMKGLCYDFMRKYAHVASAIEIVIVSVQLIVLFAYDYPEYRKPME